MHIMQADDVSSLLAPRQIVLLQPLLQQLFVILLQDRTGELKGLELVEFALHEEDVEVLNNLWKVRRNLCCLVVECTLWKSAWYCLM